MHAVKVFNESGKVESVFGLTYRSEIFNDALQIHSFDGQGYSCVVNEDGQILAALGNDELQLTQNLFSDVLVIEERNAETIEKLQEQMQLEYLQQVKCDDIQGFLFARPMPSMQFEEYLEK